MTIEQANKDLFTAISTGDYSGVLKAFKNGADVNAVRKEDKFTPLHAVIRKTVDVLGDNEAVDLHLKILKVLLVQPGCNLFLTNINGRTPVQLARHYQSLNAFADLLSEKEKVNRNLLTAIKNADKDAVLEALATGADVSAISTEGSTPLHEVIKLIKTKPSDDITAILQILLKHPFNLNQKDSQNRTPLKLATDLGLAEVVKLLSSIEATNNLFQAVKNVDFNGVSQAIIDGADVNAMHDDSTPLHLAIEQASSIENEKKEGYEKDLIDILAIIKWISDKPSCNITKLNFYAQSPRDLATELGLEQIVKLLSAREGQLKANTELFQAIETDNPYKVNAALNAGADIRAIRADGSTPLHVAIMKINKNAPNIEILNLLLAYPRRDLLLRDSRERIPIQLAAELGLVNVVRTLLPLQKLKIFDQKSLLETAISKRDPLLLRMLLESRYIEKEALKNILAYAVYDLVTNRKPGFIKILQILLDDERVRININTLDEHEQTALSYVLRINLYLGWTVKLLLENGASMDTKVSDAPAWQFLFKANSCPKRTISDVWQRLSRDEKIHSKEYVTGIEDVIAGNYDTEAAKAVLVVPVAANEPVAASQAVPAVGTSSGPKIPSFLSWFSFGSSASAPGPGGPAHTHTPK